MATLKGVNFKDLSYKDIVIYMFVEEYTLRNARQLSTIADCNYSRLTQSLNLLIEKGLVIKTETYPSQYMINGK